MGNERSFFRIDMKQEPVTVFYHKDGKEIIKTARFKDVSASGISVYADKDLDLEEGSDGYWVEFKVLDEEFLYKARVVRKEVMDQKFVYGFAIYGMTEKTNSLLVSTLFRLDIKKRRM